MHLTVLDSVTIALNDDKGAICDLVGQRYGAHLSPRAPAAQSLGAADIAINVCDDRIDPKQSHGLARHLARDPHGLCWHDAQNRAFRLDFESLNAGTWQVSCDREFDPKLFDRLLLQLLQLRLLVGKTLLCPAAAFALDGRVVLCPSAPGNGRTSLVLQMVQRGAAFLADDWVALQAPGRLRGLNRPLRLHWRTMELCPELAEQLPAAASDLANFLGHLGAGDYDLPRHLVQALEDRLHLEVTPAALFGGAATAQGGSIDAIFMPLIQPGSSQEIAVETLTPRQLANALSAVVELSLGDLLTAYAAFRLESGQRIDLIDHWRDSCEAILFESLGSVPLAYRAKLPTEAATTWLCSIIESTLQGAQAAGPAADRVLNECPAA